MAARGKNTFNQSWLNSKDKQGDGLCEYISKVDDFSVRCNWCKKNLQIDNQGKAQIVQHANSAGHRAVADVLKGRKKGQSQFVSTSLVLEKPPNEVNNNPRSKNYFLPSLSSPVSLPGNKLSLADQVSKGEALLVIKGVESQWSYSSFDNLVEVLQKVDPDSKVFAKMKLKREKASYVVKHGVGPVLHEEILADLRQAEGFTIGTDSATTKLNGLTKHMDLQVRFWSEKKEEIVDCFMTSEAVGHEDANKVVQVLTESLDRDDIPMGKLLMLSRDSPAVMVKASRLLKEHVEGLGCPLMLEGPCYLHPVHTSYKEALKQLDTEVDQLLVDVYGWFKLSTARREDMMAVFEDLDEKMEFFLRYVSTRWLTMGPCLLRLLEHWESIKAYFLKALPSPAINQTNKKAMSTDRYKNIVSMIKPSKEKANLVRIHLLIFLAKIAEPFLLSLQSEKPMIHKLYIRSVDLMVALMNLVMKHEKIPEDGRQLVDVKMEDVSNQLKVTDCNFGEGAKKELSKMRDEDVKPLLVELKKAVLVQIKYLQTHLPLKNRLLARLKFLDPAMRKAQNLPTELSDAAASMRRFDTEELASLSVQLNVYQMLAEDEVPAFDPKIDRLDHFWRDAWKVIEEKIGEKPEALIKFVKLSCSLAHGNGFVERGFSETKRVATGRESLSVESLNAQKAILGEVKKVGGAQNVSIGNKMINRVKIARFEKQKDEERKAKEQKEKKRKREEEEQAVRKKRRVTDWEEEKERLEGKIKEEKATHSEQDKFLEEALDKASSSKKDIDRKAAIACSKLARMNMEEINKRMWEHENALKKHLRKKQSD